MAGIRKKGLTLPIDHDALSNVTSDQHHNRSHAVTSGSDHTAGANKIFYSDGAGAVQEVSLGASGTYLKSQGAGNPPTWDTPAGGGGFINEFFGDISNGDATISTDATATTTRMFNTLTINAGVTYYTAGWGVYARELNLGNGSRISADGGNGGNASGSTGGTAGASNGATTNRPYGVGQVGVAGGNQGNNGNNGNNTSYASGTGGQHGGGGGGNSDTMVGGGFGGVISFISSYITQPFRTFWRMENGNFLTSNGTASSTLCMRGGASGGSGAGGSTGGGGGSGVGGGICVVYARTINAPASGTAYISANGGNGGNATGNGGGGGGGGGGLSAVYHYAITNVGNLSVEANGGAGGSGAGAGANGTAGQNGVAYRLQLSFT